MWLKSCFAAQQCLPKQLLRAAGKSRSSDKRNRKMMTMRLVMKMMAVVMMMTSAKKKTRDKKAMKALTQMRMTMW